MVRVFPVDLAVRPTFADTYGAPRPGGRVHEGTDVFAAEGTEVYAVDAGRVAHQHGSLGGNVAVLHADDSTRYVYSHLSAFEGLPRKVAAGEVIGRVGRTGNAASTLPHLHFEIHPLDGTPINPYGALVAARDATLHPPPLDEPPPPVAPSSAPTSSAIAAPAVDGIAVLLLLLWGMREMGGRNRWRLN